MPSALDAGEPRFGAQRQRRGPGPGAMIALVRSEPGADLVFAALSAPGGQCFAHYVNLCEVFYTTTRRAGEDDGEAAIRLLIDTLGVIPYESPDADFYWEVGRLRAFATSERLALSLADCFCIATARALGGELLSCDHAELDSVAAMGLCTITFIR
jgi:predicted nucleic acid-binding protein